MTERLAARRIEQWWILTDTFVRGGTRVLGPFATRELASDAWAFLMEKAAVR